MPGVSDHLKRGHLRNNLRSRKRCDMVSLSLQRQREVVTMATNVGDDWAGNMSRRRLFADDTGQTVSLDLIETGFVEWLAGYHENTGSIYDRHAVLMRRFRQVSLYDRLRRGEA